MTSRRSAMFCCALRRASTQRTVVFCDSVRRIVLRRPSAQHGAAQHPVPLRITMQRNVFVSFPARRSASYCGVLLRSAAFRSAVYHGALCRGAARRNATSLFRYVACRSTMRRTVSFCSSTQRLSLFLRGASLRGSPWRSAPCRSALLCNSTSFSNAPRRIVPHGDASQCSMVHCSASQLNV
jgi:hypothetical protein